MALSLLLLPCMLLTLLGAAMAGVWLLERFFPGVVPSRCAMLIGFCMFLLMLTWGGYLGIWRVPFLTSTLAVLCLGVGLRELIMIIRRSDKRHALLASPAFAATIIFSIITLLLKWRYLGVAQGPGDEVRSILFTSSLASNDLMPAYPFDFGLPVVYPTLFFQAGAFLLHALRGWVLPTLPLLAGTLAGFAMLAWVLQGILERLHLRSVQRSMLLLLGLLLCSSLASIKDAWGLPFAPALRFQIAPFAVAVYSGIHYLLGTVLALHGWTVLVQEGWEDRRVWQWFVFTMLLCFGLCGIPVAWVGGAFLVFAVLAIARRPSVALTSILSHIPATLFLLLLALPLLVNLVPRIDATFWFTLPDVWFARDVEKLGRGIAASLLFGPSVFLTNTGLLLGGAFLCSPLLFLWRRLRTEAFPFVLLCVTAMAILLVTRADSADWTSRGLLAALFASAFLIVLILDRLPVRWPTVLAALILLLQLVPSYWEFSDYTARAGDPSVVAIARTWPLGTVFAQEESTTMAQAVVSAGRAIVSKPPAGAVAYLPRLAILERFHPSSIFRPCGTSSFGRSTRLGWYVSIATGERVECETTE